MTIAGKVGVKKKEPFPYFVDLGKASMFPGKQFDGP